MVTTIQLEENVKSKLDNLKIHNRETYNDIVKRLVENMSGVDKESLIETIEVLSDPETMRNIAESIEEFNKGKFKTLEQVERELKGKR